MLRCLDFPDIVLQAWTVEYRFTAPTPGARPPKALTQRLAAAQQVIILSPNLPHPHSSHTFTQKVSQEKEKRGLEDDKAEPERAVTATKLAQTSSKSAAGGAVNPAAKVGSKLMPCMGQRLSVLKANGSNMTADSE